MISFDRSLVKFSESMNNSLLTLKCYDHFLCYLYEIISHKVSIVSFCVTESTQDEAIVQYRQPNIPVQLTFKLLYQKINDNFWD